MREYITEKRIEKIAVFFTWRKGIWKPGVERGAPKSFASVDTAHIPLMTQITGHQRQCEHWQKVQATVIIPVPGQHCLKQICCFRFFLFSFTQGEIKPDLALFYSEQAVVQELGYIIVLHAYSKLIAATSLQDYNCNQRHVQSGP